MPATITTEFFLLRWLDALEADALRLLSYCAHAGCLCRFRDADWRGTGDAGGGYCQCCRVPRYWLRDTGGDQGLKGLLGAPKTCAWQQAVAVDALGICTPKQEVKLGQCGLPQSRWNQGGMFEYLRC